ncbi:hypothetical protein niasHT_030539 [Heterodera trifolii]|uniref:Protein kinase domain-containing protein n=1 Tax=Heterodera trifolii TaxID=157864 RepID=A0ABD2IXZ9_9BILA
MISAQFSLAILLLFLLTLLHLSSPANARPQWYYADPISMANNRGTLFDNLWGRNEMETIEYKRRVTDSEEVLQVKIAITERINSGGSGQIFIGYYTGEVLSSNGQWLPKNKCVAIKIYSQQKGHDFIRAVKILTELKKHENMNEHIVDLMDYGMIEPGQSLSGYLSIFELADLSLFQELEIVGNRRYKSDLITLIKSIMNILVEVHEAAVHLDLKTKNILVFKKRDITNRIVSAVGWSPGFSLKLTDFDGSAFVENGVGETDQPVITPDYTSPELLEQRIYEQPSKKSSSSSSTGIYANIKKKFLKVHTETKSKTPQGKRVKKVTTKMDIWSAAISIYEIVLINFLNGSWSSNSMPINMADFRPNIENKVKRIGELCRFARLYDGTLNDDQQQMMIIKLGLVEAAFKPGSEDWWLRYSGVVINILDMWGNKYGMPDIAYLLVNMLDIDPTVRMSAKGVIDYLDGKCRPRQITLALFSNISAEQLDEWLGHELARLKEIKSNKDINYKSLKKIKEKLEKVVEIQKNFLEKLEQIEDECE